jgi:hypothetical protein
MTFVVKILLFFQLVCRYRYHLPPSLTPPGLHLNPDTVPKIWFLAVSLNQLVLFRKQIQRACCSTDPTTTANQQESRSCYVSFPFLSFPTVPFLLQCHTPPRCVKRLTGDKERQKRVFGLLMFVAVGGCWKNEVQQHTVVDLHCSVLYCNALHCTEHYSMYGEC